MHFMPFQDLFLATIKFDSRMIRYVFFAAILIFITFTLYLAFSSAEAEAEAGDKNRLNNKKSYPLG